MAPDAYVPIRLRDYIDVVEDVEEDFQSDLAVHLYLVSLLRRADPVNPPRTYYTWPLPKDEIPPSLVSTQYVDLQRPLPPEITTRFPNTAEDYVVPPVGHGRYFQFLTREADIVQNLDIEIQTLIERKVRKQLGDNAPLDGYLNPATQHIINKVKLQLHRVLQYLKWNDPDVQEYQDWQTVLLAALMAARPTGASINIPLFRQLTTRCYKMFEDTRFPYKYQSDVNYTDDNELKVESTDGMGDFNFNDGNNSHPPEFDELELLHRLRAHHPKTSVLGALYGRVLKHHDEQKAQRQRSTRRNMRTIALTLQVFEQYRRLRPSHMLAESQIESANNWNFKMNMLSRLPDVTCEDFQYTPEPYDPDTKQTPRRTVKKETKSETKANQAKRKRKATATPSKSSSTQTDVISTGEPDESVWDPSLSKIN